MDFLAELSNVEIVFPIVVICLTVFRIRAERRQAAVMESLAQVLFREAEFLAKETNPSVRLVVARRIHKVAQTLRILAS
jgi:hypothetical protein